MKRLALALTLALLLAASLSAQTVIKLGSLAPADSPWDKALLKMALDWQTISKGRVTVKVYSGGIAGDEPDMLRKMRIGQLQAAAVSGSGLGKIHPDFLVYQLPFMARNDAGAGIPVRPPAPAAGKAGRGEGLHLPGLQPLRLAALLRQDQGAGPGGHGEAEVLRHGGQPGSGPGLEGDGLPHRAPARQRRLRRAAERHGGGVHRLPALRRGPAVVRPGPQHDRLQLVAVHRRPGDLQRRPGSASRRSCAPSWPAPRRPPSTGCPPRWKRWKPRPCRS